MRTVELKIQSDGKRNIRQKGVVNPKLVAYHRSATIQIPRAGEIFDLSHGNRPFSP